MTERWKNITNYESVYQISNLGKVKNIKRNKILKPSDDGKGYMYVNLYKNGVPKNIKIHTLVAIAFLDHKPNGHKIVIDHKDNDRSNNKLSNLQILTARENSSKDQKSHNRSSMYVGVCWDKRANKWKSYIFIKGKLKHLGYFKKEFEAALEYKKTLNLIK